MKDVGIGVVGLGRLGALHAHNVAWRTPHAKLIAVCDVVEDLASQTASELGCTYYTDINKMLEDKDVDAVCVVTPTAHHVEPVTAAVQAGKPVFCEKPLAGTMEDTLSLAEMIKGAGVLFQIGFNRRFDPAYEEAHQMIQDGAIGKPVYYSGVTRDPFPPPPWACDPATGGGLFVDYLLHDFDMCRYLIGGEVDRVYGEETNLVVDPQGIDRFADNVTVSMHFQDGQLGLCHASNHVGYAHDVRTEVVGASGSILIGGLSRTEVTLCTLDSHISKPDTFLSRDGMSPFAVRFRESYEREIQAFVESIVDNQPSRANVDDAVEAYKVSVAATRSAGEKKPIDF